MLTADSKSGARFERVTIDGEPHVVKYLHVDDDWIMRCTGDLTCRPATVWRAGILDRMPPCIDHGVVGVATGLGRNGWGAAVLMRDMSPWMVPEGDGPVPLDQHLGFIEHMATLHASFWGWHDTVGLTPDVYRLAEFSPQNMALEDARGWPDAVPRHWYGLGFMTSSPFPTASGALLVYSPMQAGLTGWFLPRFDAGRWLSLVEGQRPVSCFTCM